MKAFMSFPISVRIAVVFLVTLIIAGFILIPQVMVPAFLIVGSIFSIIRILVYLTHKV